MFDNVMHNNKNFYKINNIQRKENVALLSDISVKKAKMKLEKDALKMYLANIALDCQVMNNEAKIRVNKQHSDLALEHLHAKMDSSQEKRRRRRQEWTIPRQKTWIFLKKEVLWKLFWIKHGKFHIYLKNINLKYLIVIFYVLE